MPRARRVAIVGGGYAGAVFAIHLARKATRRVEIHIVEPRAVLGAGVAFATEDPVCRLNVPTRSMFIFRDYRAHFHDWVIGRGLDRADPQALAVDGNLYMRRAVFGDYMAELVAEVAARAARLVTLVHERASAIGIEKRPSGIAVQLDDGRSVVADRVVLACSHGAPEPPWPGADALRDDSRILGDPWAGAALDRIPRDAPVLIAGTALTMADVYASLRARFHTGLVTAVSRRGLCSQVFAPFEEGRVILENRPIPSTASSMLAAVRGEIDRLGRLRWRDVIDACRWNAPRLWGCLPEAERRRLLRHVRPWWDTHRYRIAPQVGDVLEAGRSRGDIVIRAARIVSVTPSGSNLSVAVRPRGGDRVETIEVGAIVNCSGPSHRVTAGASPLYASMLGQGMVAPDPVGLGLRVDDACRTIDAQERVNGWLRAIGPLTRARFGEIVGAPEIGVQADRVAGLVLAELQGAGEGATT